MEQEKVNYSWKLISTFFIVVLIFSSFILYIEIYNDSLKKDSDIGEWKYCETQLYSDVCKDPEYKWKPVDITAKKNISSDSNYIEFKKEISADSLLGKSLLFSASEQKIHIYLNSQQIFSNGAFDDEDLIGGLRWNHVYFPKNIELKEKNELLIKIYSPKNNWLGRFNYFYIDKEYKNIQKIYLFDVLNVTSLSITFLLIIVMSVFYYKEKEHKSTYLASILFLSLFFFWLVGILNIKYLVIPDNRYWWIELNLCAYTLPIFANYITYTVLTEKKNKRNILIIMGLYGIIEVAAIVGELLGYGTINSFMGILYSVLLFFEAYVLYMTYQEVTHGNHYAKALFLCIVIFPIMGVIDGLGVYFQLYNAKFFLFPLSIYSFFIFMLLLINEQLKKDFQLKEQSADLRINIDNIIEESNIDKLTKCLNRESFEQCFEDCCSASKNTNRPFSFLILDIDKFKRFNDRYGHDVGDMVLINFTNTVRKYLPGNPPFFRWGGEEFVIMMPYLDLSLALYLADCIRRGVEKADIHNLEKVTCSIGIAEWHFDEDSKQKMIIRADKALYYAKENGRNRIATEKVLEKET